MIKNDRKRGQKNPNDTVRIVENYLKLKKKKLKISNDDTKFQWSS